MTRDPESATLWLIRGGSDHKLVRDFLEDGVVGVPFDKLADGTGIDHAGAMQRMKAADMGGKLDTAAMMFCAFVRGIEVDHIMLMPDPAMRGLAVGWVDGEYVYAPSIPEGKARHRRQVQWIRRIPYSTLGSRLEALPRQRNELKKIDDGYARQLVKAALLDGEGEDPLERKNPQPIRERSAGVTTATSRAPKKVAKVEPETRVCSVCMMTKRVEIFEGDSRYCMDCS